MIAPLLAVDTIRPRTWADCRDFAAFIGGPNPALRDEQPYSPAHHAAVCQKFGDPAALVSAQWTIAEELATDLKGRLG